MQKPTVMHVRKNHTHGCRSEIKDRQSRSICPSDDKMLPREKALQVKKTNMELGDPFQHLNLDKIFSFAECRDYKKIYQETEKMGINIWVSTRDYNETVKGLRAK